MKPNTLFNAIIWIQIAMQFLFPMRAIAASTQAPLPSPAIFEHSALVSDIARNLASAQNAPFKNTATSLAGSAAASSLEDWFAQFGTARIQLNMDDSGHWDDSAFDFLYPVYDDKKSILFTQLGLRAPDNRMTGNIGIGVRTFYTENWMFGGNFFFDEDFTGTNRRVGIGAESWTNYLKLSANTYAGTTQWHSSRDFDSYNEKPADGFDIRAEGYLPAWPQLGTKVIYEKYYGENVALFDKEHLQRNPSAITTGISYTPVSIVTAGIDYRHGQSSLDEFRFTLGFRYELGRTLQSQLSPEQVATRRTLAGSRYDLVERNNEIILQYKKKESSNVVADITLTNITNNSPADGSSENIIKLHAVNSAGQPVKNAAISWSITGHGLLNHATSITDATGNTTVSVTNTTAEHLTVTASTGSLVRSLPSIFTGAVADLDFILTKNNSHADGIDQNRAVVTVKDPAGNPMPGIAIDWQVSNGATIISADKTTDGKGQAIVSVVNHKAGPVQLTASTGGKSVQLTATFIQAPISNIAVTMSTDNALADGTSANVAHARVTDAAGQPAAGVSLTWSLAGSAIAATPLTVTTDASGEATLRLTDTVAETVPVSASAGGQQGQTPATFIRVPVGNIVVTMSTDNAPADGTSANVAHARVTDAAGQPAAGVSLTWSLAGSAIAATPLTVTTDASGEATLRLTDTVAETVPVSASAGGQQGQTPATFIRVPVGNIVVTMSTDNAPADGTSANVAHARVTDAAGQPAAGVSLTWSLAGSAIAATPLTVTTDASGEATLRLTDTVAETVPVSASAGGQQGQTPATFIRVPVGNIVVTMSTDNAPADGTSANVAHARVTDAAGQPAAGVSLTWSLAGSAIAATPLTVTTDASGEATLRLTDTVAETVPVSASAGGQQGQTPATFIRVPVGNIVVTMSTDNAPADGTSANVAHARVTDAAGQPAAGVSLTWSLAGSAIAATPLTVTTDASGEATLRLTDTVAETVPVSASAGGQQGQTPATFTALKAVSISFRQSGKGNSADPGIVTATIKDNAGHGISGAHVTWTPIQNNRLHCSAPDTITNGVGEVSLVCYASGANVVGQPITLAVLPEDSQDPGQPVTGTYHRDYNL